MSIPSHVTPGYLSMLRLRADNGTGVVGDRSLLQERRSWDNLPLEIPAFPVGDCEIAWGVAEKAAALRNDWRRELTTLLPTFVSSVSSSLETREGRRNLVIGTAVRQCLPVCLRAIDLDREADLLESNVFVVAEVSKHLDAIYKTILAHQVQASKVPEAMAMRHARALRAAHATRAATTCITWSTHYQVGRIALIIADRCAGMTSAVIEKDPTASELFKAADDAIVAAGRAPEYVGPRAPSPVELVKQILEIR